MEAAAHVCVCPFLCPNLEFPSKFKFTLFKFKVFKAYYSIAPIENRNSQLHWKRTVCVNRGKCSVAT